MKLSDPRLRMLELMAYDEKGKLKPGWNLQVGTEDGETDVILYDEYAMTMEDRKKKGLPPQTREEFEIDREVDRLLWLALK